MNKGTVAVGFLHPGEWSASFGMSLVDLYLVDAHGPQRIIPHGKQLPYLCASGGIPDARNEVARCFLDDTECEWLFMVDSDMGFGPTVVEDLIATAGQTGTTVVGGLCFALKKEGAGTNYTTVFDIVPTIYDWYEDAEQVGFVPRLDYEQDAIVACGATGGACLLIHRTALEQIRSQHGDVWFDRILHPKKRTKFSEDLSFCIRLAAAGIALFVDTAVKTSHHKGGIYLDELTYGRQQDAVAAQLAQIGA